jgi:predicted HicB family RNase H-like nuclease
MSKDLKYYLGLDYTFEIRKLPKEDGGDYLASIPQLGANAFCADGKTIEEALTNLKTIKEDLFRDYLKEGIPIPEPEPEPETIFSGKFVVRIPPVLHRQLVKMARKQNMSLNQFVVYLLSYNTPLTALEAKLEECFDKIERKMSVFQAPSKFSLETIQYSFAGERIGTTTY